MYSNTILVKNPRREKELRKILGWWSNNLSEVSFKETVRGGGNFYALDLPQSGLMYGGTLLLQTCIVNILKTKTT